MELIYNNVIRFLWLVWVAYWLLSAAKVKATIREEPIAARVAHLLPMIVAILLLFTPRSLPWGPLGERML
jgi:hypothetical protein